MFYAFLCYFDNLCHLVILIALILNKLWIIFFRFNIYLFQIFKKLVVLLLLLNYIRMENSKKIAFDLDFIEVTVLINKLHS